MVTQKQCQIESGLGNKLFKRTLEMCRAAKNLDESKINFISLTKKFEGQDAIPFMTKIFAHFKDSCFEAGIVDKATWDANYILVLCAVFCWTCDRVAAVRTSFFFFLFDNVGRNLTYNFGQANGQSPTYNGPDVAFHCGLGWENVQKSFVVFILSSKYPMKHSSLLLQNVL
jgi:hypothetical protein